MKRIPEFTVAVLVCISVVVYWSQHRRIRQLESENRVLVLERDLADADRQAQVPPAHPPTPDRGEQERVAEVLRLRAEVNRLEALVRGTSAKTASGPGAASAPPAAPEEVLQDLGNATPDAAATTLLWALMQADEERFRALIHDSVEWPPQVAGRLHRRMFELQRQNYGNRTFTGVRGIRPKEDGSVRVDFGFLDPDSGKETTTLLHLRQGPSGWGLDPGPPPPEWIQEAVEPP